MPLLRGAIPTPRHILAAAVPHAPIPCPPQFLRKPVQISMWNNDQYGCCVTAEEAFNKACNNPEIFITDQEVYNWANTNGYLNGAMLTDVMQKMQTAGFQQNAATYDDGPYNSVNWNDAAILQSAIFQGTVKIGIAADQLQTVYEAANPVEVSPAKGWIATGFTEDGSEDHCVALTGYGSIGWLAEQLGIIVAGIDSSTAAYALFTWDSIGIIDSPSLSAICGEAWLRAPSTIVVN